jgi:SAM-dependent methyltransferase
MAHDEETDLAKEYVISFFDRNLMLHKDGPEAVRWTVPGQILHYESMLDIGPLEGKRILDFGCGIGGFYGFLRERGITVDYTGCDLNPTLIAHARKKYPGADFRVLDLDQQDLAEEFDYILLCGVFNLRVQGLDDLILRTLSKLYTRCRIGLAYNGISAHSPDKDYEIHYVMPEQLFTFAIQYLSPFVALRHDRMQYDFTLFVYRGPNRFQSS